MLAFFSTTVEIYGAYQEKMEPVVLSSKLTDLEADTKYLIYVSAVTNAGPGVELFIEDDTLPLSSKSLYKIT